MSMESLPPFINDYAEREKNRATTTPPITQPAITYFMTDFINTSIFTGAYLLLRTRGLITLVFKSKETNAMNDPRYNILFPVICRILKIAYQVKKSRSKYGQVLYRISMTHVRK